MNYFTLSGNAKCGHISALNFRKVGYQAMILDRIALILVIIGAMNWGSIGMFQFDLVAFIFGGQGALLSRVIYTLVALAGLWCVSLLFRGREESSVM